MLKLHGQTRYTTIYAYDSYTHIYYIVNNDNNVNFLLSETGGPQMVSLGVPKCFSEFLNNDNKNYDNNNGDNDNNNNDINYNNNNYN